MRRWIAIAAAALSVAVVWNLLPPDPLPVLSADAIAERAAMEVLPPGTLRVATHAHVHPLPDGAFVEATIWVPKEDA